MSADRRLLLLIAITSITAASSAARASEQLPQSEAFARRALAAADVVLDHHVAPPTRQEMVLAALRSTYAAAKAEPPRELARAVSEAAHGDALAALLRAAYESAAEIAPPDFEEQAWQALLQPALGAATYLPPGDFRVSQQIAGNRYEGIGIRLSYAQDEELPVVDALFARGPLDAAGGFPKDRITHIDGKATRGLGLGEVVALLRGERGSEIRLVVQQPQGEPRELRFTREVIPFELVTGSKRDDEGQWRHQIAEGVAYVRLATIGASTLLELRNAERKARAEGCTSLVLDLRFSGGGDLHYANIAADAFLTSGSLGKVRTASGEEEFKATGDAIFRDWPLVVLVNAGTRGDAEWLAAALQSNRRARLIGEPTPGEIAFETIVPLPVEQGGVLLTTAIAVGDHVRPLGRGGEAVHDFPGMAAGSASEKRGQRFGLIPDHAVQLDEAAARRLLAAFGRQGVKTGEDDSLPTDAQLEKAIETLTPTEAAEDGEH